jgi:hypothetical protein
MYINIYIYIYIYKRIYINIYLHIGTIGVLVSLLSGVLNDRCMNHILLCIFNLCRISKRRQEEAAIHGIYIYVYI